MRARRRALLNLSTAGVMLAAAPSAFAQSPAPGPLYASQFGVSSSNSDNSTYLLAAINAAISQSKQLIFDAGTFFTNTVTIGAGHYNFQGMGVGNTIFQPLSGGNTVFEFSNSGYNSGNIGGFSIFGSGAGSGDGISIASGNYFNFELHDIQIRGMGGVGLHNANCTPTLIGCNVEDFNVSGLRCRSQVPIIINTGIGAAQVGTVTALTLDFEPTNQGQFVNGTVYTAGASWLKGQPFHSRIAPPFALYQVAAGANSYQYYDDQNAETLTMGALGSANTPPGSLTMSPYYSSLAAAAMYIGTPGKALVGIYSGSGAPTSGAVQGSLYLRTDGGPSTSLYVNTSGSTTWSPV